MSVCHPCKAVAIIFRLLLYPLRVSLGAHYTKYGEAMRNAKNIFSPVKTMENYEIAFILTDAGQWL